MNLRNKFAFFSVQDTHWSQEFQLESSGSKYTIILYSRQDLMDLDRQDPIYYVLEKAKFPVQVDRQVMRSDFRFEALASSTLTRCPCMAGVPRPEMLCCRSRALSKSVQLHQQSIQKVNAVFDTVLHMILETIPEQTMRDPKASKIQSWIKIMRSRFGAMFD